LLPSGRDLSAATFLILSIVSGLIALGATIGVVHTVFTHDESLEDDPGARLTVIVIFAGTAALSALLSFLAASSAIRRLYPKAAR
jgi:hypothetical protein